MAQLGEYPRARDLLRRAARRFGAHEDPARALRRARAAGQVRSIGRARARRWLSPPLAGFTTSLLLPTALPPE
ncbi:MAG: hypothetical protein ACXWVP_06155 [Burkholderiales bacterium]